MKKEKKEIAVNTSSGAEKVETLGKTSKAVDEGKRVKETKLHLKEEENTAVEEAALGNPPNFISAKKENAKIAGSKAEKESLAAKRRVEAAIERKAREQRRKEERAKRAARRKAELEKQLKAIEKKQAEKRAKREEALRQRAHAKANKRAAQARRKENEKKNKEARPSRAGYGGWLAAVLSLGVVTLALTTAVTVGGVELSRMKKGATASHKASMCELTEIMERVDADLDRVRVSASPVQQSRILTDLLVQTRLAEMDMEKLPIKLEEGCNVTTFINRTAMECERMLAKLRKGERLSEEDMQTLERLYKTNRGVCEGMDKMLSTMQDVDIAELMKKGAGKIKDALKELEEMTLEENRIGKDIEKDKKDGAGAKQSPQRSEESRIDTAQAEERCKAYFSDYKVGEFQCVGETVTRSYAAYNVQAYDDKGTLLFAEISQKDGALLRFDYYEDCSGETFDLQNAGRIADEFLQKLGYTGLERVRAFENGTTTDFTYVYSDEGVAYYPDEIRIKVCRTRGMVTGLDTTKYLKNHKDRSVTTAITMEQAYDKLRDGLDVQSARLCVVKTAYGEDTAYEFLCGYQKERYLIYLSATTGEEISIVNVRKVM